MALENISRAVFVGQLFKGDPKSKNWTPLVNGQVGVSLKQVREGEWYMVAVKKEKVWELRVDKDLKHRVRDGFVQWQKKGHDGAIETYGLRVKNDVIGQQMSESIFLLLRKMEDKRIEYKVDIPAPPTVQPSDIKDQDVVLVKVILPGNDSTNVCVPGSATVKQILKSVCLKRGLDSTHFMASLPPNSPNSHPVVCKGNMTVDELSTNEIHLLKRHKLPRQQTSPELSMPDSSGSNPDQQMLLLQVELPRNQRTVVRVTPSILMADLLQYICDKRNIDMARYKFDLPATEESLAGRTLNELKLNAIKIISKVPSNKSDQSDNSSLQKKKTREHSTEERASSLESSKSNRRRASTLDRHYAPPLPPTQQRRTKPDLIKELTAEMVGRNTLHKRKRIDSQEDDKQSHDNEDLSHDIEGTPSDSASNKASAVKQCEDSDQSNCKTLAASASKGSLKPRTAPAPLPPTEEEKPHPPLVSDKNQSERGCAGIDETDSVINHESVVHKGQEVIGVKGKVKQQMERAGLTDSITDALKQQTAYAERRHTGLAPQGNTTLLGRGANRRGSLDILPARRIQDTREISSEDDTVTSRPQDSKSRKPRGAAPPPPLAYKNQTLSKNVTPPLSNPVGSLPATTRLLNSNVRGVSENRDGLGSIANPLHKEPASSVNKTTRSRPSRRAPVRPSNKSLNSKTEDKKLQKPSTAPSQESGPLTTPPQESGPLTTPPQGSGLSTAPSQESDRSTQLSNSSPASQHQANAVTAICKDTQDGGKMLIVQPSPSTDRKQKKYALIFKLPPPPSQQTYKTNTRQTREEIVRESDKISSSSLPLETPPQEDTSLTFEPDNSDVLLNSQHNETIVSNEYTNLDDSSSDEELDTLTQPPPFEPLSKDTEHREMGTGSDNGMESRPGNRIEGSVDDETDKSGDCTTTGLNISTTSSAGSEGEYNLSVDQSISSTDGLPPPVEEPHVPIPPPPVEEPDVPIPPPPMEEPREPDGPPLLTEDGEVLLDSSLNSNSNNSNHSSHSGEESLAGAVLPPPPVAFLDQSSEVSLDSSAASLYESSLSNTEIEMAGDFVSKQADPEQQAEGILLLSYKPVKKAEDVKVGLEVSPEVTELPQDGWAGKDETNEGSKVIVTSPSIGTQLDDMASDLKDLSKTDDEHANKPSEAPPIVHTVATPIPPTPSPCPVISSTPLQTTPIQATPVTSKSPPNNATKSSVPAKPKPPLVAVKGKPPNVNRRKPSTELLDKFKERREKLTTPSPEESLPGAPPVPIPNSMLTSISQAPLPPSVHPVATPITTPPGAANDSVHLQLQFLQQQVLQQQMLQLQQQFQQLQSFSMQQTPGMSVPVMGMVPGGGLYQPQTNPIGAHVMYPPQQAVPGMFGNPSFIPSQLAGASVPGMPFYHPQAVGEYATPPQSGTMPAKRLSTVGQMGVATNSPNARRKLSEEYRSAALGDIEDKFDSVMEEVKVIDTSNILKKIPEEPIPDDSPSYTGMAAALAGALKQRRQHFADRSGTSRDMDDSLTTDWQSP